jgi:hypothetical protein
MRSKKPLAKQKIKEEEKHGFPFRKDAVAGTVNRKKRDMGFMGSGESRLRAATQLFAFFGLGGSSFWLLVLETLLLLLLTLLDIVLLGALR